MENFGELYGKSASAFPERMRRLEAVFRSRYAQKPALWFSSPGRAEIVGNHTDHNGGKVLVTAVSCDILCAVSPRTDGVVEIAAEHYRPVRFHLKELAKRERERGKSSALARGVAKYLAEKGKLCGFNACTDSTIFRGAGVSSSAAFEVLIAEIFNSISFGGTLSATEKAKAGKFAENVYFGKPCGLLDQAGIAYGGFRKIDFADADKPKTMKVPKPEGYALAIVNTGGSHAALTHHYAAITREMKAVAGVFSKNRLRDVPEEVFYAEVSALRKKVGDRAVLRAIHFFEENKRVDRAADALVRGDLRAFFAQIRRSGESSLGCLQNCYVPGEASQPVPLALRLSERLIKDGAFRMQGGGFTGSVIAFVKDGEAENYLAEMARVFGSENVFLTDFRACGTCTIKI